MPAYQRGDQEVQGGEERAGSVAHRRLRPAPDDGRFLNEVGADKITPARVLARAKAFHGPLALGSPKLQCGKYKTAPGICNDMFQAFTYQGKFAFKRASGWIGPPEVAVDERRPSIRRGRFNPGPVG